MINIHTLSLDGFLIEVDLEESIIPTFVPVLKKVIQVLVVLGSLLRQKHVRLSSILSKIFCNRILQWILIHVNVILQFGSVRWIFYSEDFKVTEKYIMTLNVPQLAISL
jgi:hypothetical protein